MSKGIEILGWLQEAKATSLPYADVVEILHEANKRSAFLKQLPRNAVVLDAGAGDGALQRFRHWLRPFRKDLRMFAYAAELGEEFQLYDGFEIGFWPQETPDFDGIRFDAILACHFIEHLVDPSSFVQWALGRLKPGGRIYLEWPSQHSLSLPPAKYFRDAGIPLVVSNFYDDHTHQFLPTAQSITETIMESGAGVEASGVIRFPWLEDELVAHWQAGHADRYALQAAFWSRTRWSQFMIVQG